MFRTDQISSNCNSIFESLFRYKIQFLKTSCFESFDQITLIGNKEASKMDNLPIEVHRNILRRLDNGELLNMSNVSNLLVL